MHLYLLCLLIITIFLDSLMLVLGKEYTFWSYSCDFLHRLAALVWVHIFSSALFLKHCHSVLVPSYERLRFTCIWSYCQWKRVAEEHTLLQDLFQVLLFELCPELKAEWWCTFQNERPCVRVCVSVCAYVQICIMEM